MIYLFSVWVALAALILGMALYRNFVARNEDDVLHLAAGTDRVVNEQASLAARLTRIDKWGRSLTVFETVFGAAILAFWLYNAWLESVR